VLTSPVNTKHVIAANGLEAHSAVHPVIGLMSRQTGPRESTCPKRVIFSFYSRQSPLARPSGGGLAQRESGRGPARSGKYARESQKGSMVRPVEELSLLCSAGRI
jgi:hypothetical protein